MAIEETLARAVGLHRAGDFPGAEAIYRDILARQPDEPNALYLLGSLAQQTGRSELAVELITRAIAVNPTSPDYHNNLGVILTLQKQADRAVAAYQKAIALRPDYPEAYFNLGLALRDLNRPGEAAGVFAKAIQFQQNNAEAFVQWAGALVAIGRQQEALAAYQQAIRLSPNNSAAMNDAGLILRNMGRLDESIALFRNALRLRPDFAPLHVNLANVIKGTGRLDEAATHLRKAIALNPHYAEAHSDLILLMQYVPGVSAGAIFRELHQWNDQHAVPLEKLIQPHGNDRDPHRRLRIGYVSPDFRDHVVGQNLLPLMRRHDHQQFEIFCYANLDREDFVTPRFRECADAWRDISRLSDAEAAELIRKDGIDILIDLAVHTGGNRLRVFAQKPAPVQATFAGYPGSTGLDAMDYRLTDRYLDPPESSDEFYSETSVRVGDSFWCYEPLFSDMPVGPPPAESGEFITLGCLSNFSKMNARVVRIWASVLKKVDRARMMILCPEGSHRRGVIEAFAAEGIDAVRIELVAPRPRQEYVRLYGQIDLGLDTVPYNGHTTSLDSYWMGVPMVTLVGETVVGRAGLSQLSNLGLGELVANSEAEFVEIAAKLASDLPRLAEIRRTLRGRMRASPLMDAVKFTQGIESAYREMWRRWCAGGGQSRLK